MPQQQPNTLRRSSLKALFACSCCFSSLLHARTAVAASPELILGCTLDDMSTAALIDNLNQGIAISALGSDDDVANFSVNGLSHRVVASSGDSQFDRALAESLFHISELFEITPTFGFIQNARQPNAYATNKRYTPTGKDQQLPSREDGTVLLSDSILAWMKNKGIDDPVAAIIAICAHEFGHIAQYKFRYENNKISDLLRRGEPNVKRLELHADFLSGYYIGVARHRNPLTPAATVAYATSVIGDDQTTSFNHHGTPDERGAAVVAGYYAGHERRIKFKDALLEGLKYVGAIT